MIPTKEENPKGLYQKYLIRKITGWRNDRVTFDRHFRTKAVDDHAEYFVLRLDINGGDSNHIKACRKAIQVYADEIEATIPQLAKDLRERYAK